MADSILLEYDQRNYLGRLETGQAIVKLQGRWLKPFLIKAPLIPIKKGSVTDEHIKKQNRGYLAEKSLYSLPGQFQEVLRDILSTAKENNKEIETTPGERIYLKDIVHNPLSAVVERNRRLNLTVYRGNKIKESLLKKGLIRVVSLSTNAGKVKILRLTDKGKELAERLGYKYKNFPKNGSVKHEYWKKAVKNMYKKAGYKVKEEIPLKDGGSVDLVASDEKELIAIEVETGKSDAVIILERI